MKIKTAGVKPIEFFASVASCHVPHQGGAKNENFVAKINCKVCRKYLGLSKGKILTVVCANCWRAYRDNHADPDAKALKKLKKTMKLYDPRRWACVHREFCLDKYREYACLPCKNCKDYVLQHGGVDIMDRARNEEAA